MRVNNSGNTPNQSGEVSGTKQTGRSAATHASKRAEKGSAANESEKTRGDHGVNAEISPKSKEFAQAKAVATETSDTRDERIAELKKRIAEGNYKVDTGAVADRMVDDHLKMSGMR